MRIAVTGGTGYLGAHTVNALLAAGHDVKLLIHPSEPVSETLRMFDQGSEPIAQVGDIRDHTVVETLLQDCDSVLHAAGVVGTDDRREQLMWEVNTGATTEILVRAHALGLDPIVHVASYSALFPCPDPVITPDSPTAIGRSAYGRTKSAADRIARALQHSGAPVVITYPSSVVGPGIGGLRGITETGWDSILKMGVAPRFAGGMQMIDVRDVAAVHAAVMEPGRGPRRYLCGGHLISFNEMIDLLEQESGVGLRRVPLHPGVLRGLGRIADAVGKIVPVNAGLTYEAAWLLTTATPTDDTATLRDFGMSWRPIRQAYADTFASRAASAAVAPSA